MSKLRLVFFPFLLLLQAAAAQESSNLDVRLFRSINDRQSSGEGFFEVLDKTTIPSFIAIPAGFLSYGAIQNDSEIFETGLLMGTSQAVALGSTFILKSVVSRTRPFDALANVKVKSIESATGSSFPSGHTSQAFAIATILTLSNPKPIIYIPLIFWAGLVGYDRIYLGLHYPSDVLGGAVIGIGSALLVWNFRDDIARLREKVLGEQSSKFRFSVAPFAGTKLVQLQIKLD